MGPATIIRHRPDPLGFTRIAAGLSDGQNLEGNAEETGMKQAQPDAAPYR
jgi:hypothetical protein